MACGACGGGPGFTPATYKATTPDGKESVFLTKTQAIMHLQRAGGGNIETVKGKPRK
jgi:hypothetical protein